MNILMHHHHFSHVAILAFIFALFQYQHHVHTVLLSILHQLFVCVSSAVFDSEMLWSIYLRGLRSETGLIQMHSPRILISQTSDFGRDDCNEMRIAMICGKERKIIRNDADRRKW